MVAEKAFTGGGCLPDPQWLAGNISPFLLRDLTLPKRIREAAEAAAFPLNRVVIEITESALVENLEHAQTIARELKAQGCRLALDHFGTGYSSLLHLQSLPFDELKVDRSFVGSMTTRRESRKIVSAVVGLGQSLGMETIAEGVETQDQAEMLLLLGCAMGQGWLFGTGSGWRRRSSTPSAPAIRSMSNAGCGPSAESGAGFIRAALHGGTRQEESSGGTAAPTTSTRRSGWRTSCGSGQARRPHLFEASSRRDLLLFSRNSARVRVLRDSTARFMSVLKAERPSAPAHRASAETSPAQTHRSAPAWCRGPRAPRSPRRAGARRYCATLR